jgi:hypothetical protein
MMVRTRTRSKNIKAQAKWNREWKDLWAADLVRSFDQFLEALPEILINNSLTPGAHWCVILENSEFRGQLCQVTGEVEKGRIEIEGKLFKPINELMVLVPPKRYQIPVYFEA